MAFSGSVAVFDLSLHVKLSGEQRFQDFTLLRAQVCITASVELSEDHVDHGPISVDSQLFQERSAYLKRVACLCHTVIGMASLSTGNLLA